MDEQPSFAPSEITGIALGGAFVFIVLFPCLILCCGGLDFRTSWMDASCASTRTAPLPAEHHGALVRVYYARAFNCLAAWACHPWIAFKERGGDRWESVQVIGWKIYGGDSTCVDWRTGPPDRLWYGQRPNLAGELSGDDAEAAIPRIRAAVASYRYAGRYRVWPGPNSNTFAAHVIRDARLGCALPPHALGKDFKHGRGCAQLAPSRTGIQASLFGLGIFGVTLSWREGVRVQLLSLEFGLTPWRGELHLPGLGTLRLAACCLRGGRSCADPVAPSGEPVADRDRGGWNFS